MSRVTNILAVAGLCALASPLAAQARGRPGGPPEGGRTMGRPPVVGPVRGGADVAEQLLARTGALRLTDQQVTRLAAIARRSADRRQTMRRSMDSLMTARAAARPDSNRGRMGPPPEMRASADRMRDQLHGELRDALAVLTPDQLATAWELVAQRAPGAGRGFGGAPPMGPMRSRQGMLGAPGGAGPGAPRGAAPARPSR